MGDTLIHALMIGDFGGVICLRASRFWDFFDPHDETKLLHSDLVLVDEEGNSIHGQMYPPVHERFKAIIKEGAVYNFQYFKVKKCNRNYRPVKNPNMISFSKWTIVEEVIEVPPAFPMYAYSLTPLEEVAARLDSNEYLTDVIGVVTAISNAVSHRIRAKQSDSLKRTIAIRNASNATANVVLWGEQAAAFPGEQLYNDGKASPQVVMFVGALVRNYSDGLSVSGNTSCKWYINPDIPEASILMDNANNIHEPIKWNEQVTSSVPAPNAEHKKISEIKDLHPFRFKKAEFLVTVTIKKIDSSWWYHACKTCMRTAKPHGDSYKCTDFECGTVGFPAQRYKLSIIAGDETGDTDFIVFGRMAQRLIKKSADTLIGANPPGFIPNEITNLLEKVFLWNVSFTENTKLSGNVCFQVNGIVGQIDSGNALVPLTPATSQTSSVMLSPGASGSVQSTPQKASTLPPPALPTSSCASYGSSGTPSKMVMSSTGPPITPQSRKASGRDEIADPQPTAGTAVATNQSAGKDQKGVTGKRARRSPNKKVSKKLVLDEEDGDKDSTTAADDVTGLSPSQDA